MNLVSGRLVSCYGRICDIYQEGSWQHLQDVAASRVVHSSATTENAVLLIGGIDSDTTEWIPVDGSPAQEGPFTVRHGSDHCTIQVSANAVVVTGGKDTESYVTQYDLVEGNETTLTPLGQPRNSHACGVYQDAGGQQVSITLFSCNQCALCSVVTF